MVGWDLVSHTQTSVIEFYRVQNSSTGYGMMDITKPWALIRFGKLTHYSEALCARSRFDCIKHGSNIFIILTTYYNIVDV